MNNRSCERCFKRAAVKDMLCSVCISNDDIAIEVTHLKPLPESVFLCTEDESYAIWTAHEGWWLVGANCREVCQRGCPIDAGQPVYLSGVVGETYCVEHATVTVQALGKVKI